MLARTIAAVTLALLGAVPAHAAIDAETCQAKKAKLAGVHAACRLKADAKAIRKGDAPDYAKCDEAIAKKFGKLEEKAGPDTCPTEQDADRIAAILAESTARVTEQLEAPDAGCPIGYRDRSPSEVLADWLDAYASENVPLLLCNYHPLAHVFTDQGILVGYGDITLWYESLWDLLSGVNPQVAATTTFRSSVRLLSRLNAGWVEIEDGVDTFEIEDGRIRSQTSHGLITFNGPPPDQS